MRKEGEVLKREADRPRLGRRVPIRPRHLAPVDQHATAHPPLNTGVPPWAWEMFSSTGRIAGASGRGSLT